MRNVGGVVLAVMLVGQWDAVTKDLEHKVPRLAVMKNGNEGTCSAVVINAKDGYAITAAHCVEAKNKDEIDITLHDHHAESVKVNRLLDLAVVKFEPDSEIEVPLAQKTPERGTAVAVAGYPFGIEDVAMQRGYVMIPKESSTKLLWLNVDLLFGDSGGAVFNEQGELIGINSQILAAGPAHLAMAVPIERVKDFVQKFLPKK